MWNMYFQNSDGANCPIINCYLFDTDCTSAFPGSAVIQISSSLQVTMDLSGNAVYDYIVCVKCETAL